MKKHPVIQASFSFFLPRTCSRPSFFAYTVYAAGQESARSLAFAYTVYAAGQESTRDLTLCVYCIRCRARIRSGQTALAVCGDYFLCLPDFDPEEGGQANPAGIRIL